MRQFFRYTKFISNLFWTHQLFNYADIDRVDCIFNHMQ